MPDDTRPDQARVSQVVELAVEPSYVSEIVRKLRQVDSSWAMLQHEAAVVKVSRIVRTLENDGRMESVQPNYDGFGGQEEASAHYRPQQTGVAESRRWRQYRIVRSTETDYESARDEFKDFVDPDVTMEDKIELADFISRMGNRVSVDMEIIAADQLSAMVREPDTFEVSEYSDPGIDIYIEGGRFVFLDTGVLDQGIAVEVSTRFVNPIGGPYINSKINKLIDKESETGVPVDLVVMAPRIRDAILEKYEEDDFIHLIEFPEDIEGNPVIIPDDPDTRRGVKGSEVVGEDYPAVDDERDTFTTDLEEVFRDFEVYEEMELRRAFVEAVGEVL